MTDLFARLRAAIEERLALARAATPGPWHRTWMGDKLSYALGSDVERDDGSRPVIGRAHHQPDAAFIAANHPAWAIRALEADLERLDRHVPQGWGEDTIRRHPAVTDERWCAWCADRALAWPCPEVFALARVYLEEEA